MNTTKESKAPSRLLSAALAGLMAGSLTACSNDKDSNDDNQEPTALAPMGTTDSKIISKTPSPGLTFATFSSDCQTRGGLVQTHAVCSGNNSCKGLSFNKYSETIVEHSCRGANTCGGMSCVDLPKDTGLAAEEIFAKSCGECHGFADEVTKIKDPGAFKVYAAPGGSLTQAEEAFRLKSPAAHVAIVAFGTHGVNSNGTPYSNMPSFYEKLSRAEIERVVGYLRQLNPRGEEYTIFGENAGL